MKWAANLEPEVLERIGHHRRRTLFLKLAMLAPLLLANALLRATAIICISIGTGSLGSAASGDAPAAWGILFLLAVVLGISAARRGASPLKEYPIGKDPAQNVFRNALDGVSMAIGFKPPDLAVLDVPTANSIAFLKGDEPAAGVTVEALVTNLSPHDAEAMMAHELAHILAGDIFMGSNSRRLRLTSCSLVFMLCGISFFVSFSLGLTWVIPSVLLCLSPVLLYCINRAGRLLYRHNDLLADSVAAKITCNPAGLKKAIERLGALYLENREPFSGNESFADYMFINRVRPEVTMQRVEELTAQLTGGDEERSAELRETMRKNVEKRGGFHEATIEERIVNLRAIELGFFPEFERDRPGP